MERGVACIFAKPPGAGAKTRLAAILGARAAEELAGAFLSDTWASITRWGRARPVLATPDVRADHGLPRDAIRWPQGEGDLGDRLERVLRRALLQAPWVIALGADSPGLPHDHLDQLVDGLGTAEACVGPAEDGGFWGLALRGCPSGLLRDLPWSAPTTCDALRRRLVERGLSVNEAPPWFDVDHAEDLARFRRHVPRDLAPRTWAALERPDRG